MPTNADYTREYFDIMESLGGDVEGRRAAYDYMQDSTAIVHHKVVACSFVPRLFNAETYRTMKETAETAHRILVKVIARYLEDPSYRRAFDFDPRLEELILLPRGYDSLLPFARVDTFLDEDDYRMKFCEFNGDGSSGMNENREITHSIENTATFKEFASRHRVQGCELFESWVRTFMDIYATYERRVENPRIAICDYLENGVVDEFRIYADLFKRAGADCVVADVRDLRFDGEVLRDAEGGRVDAIWRRCVTNDVIDHWDESQQLIDAVRAEKVALIGSFAGHIVHDKQLFNVLFDERTTAFLDADEISFIEETVPLTAFLDDEHVNLPQIRENRCEWIIKPTDHYGADEVYAGEAVTQEEWERLIDRFANGRAGYPFIVQRYIRPFKTETLPPDAGIDQLPDGEVPREPKLYNNLNGLYLYDGEIMGVFSRLGPLPTISKDMQGMTAATIWVDRD
ncbi:carboxylate--amine ligase [Gordonibacter massiliensis (ex Traore et al. 2017)]|uniref:carboxylate--amine ligase n=1 Tax=Gordonibacter massiliensis (ex Traore et al. 2017) TaxID=1841863 RepID=UPI001C8C9257|nr:carboxylate--amine ligase [Gordonibacter massiliensis (ex Traore et al. 2017)]MBX9033958.1 SDR family oxidoreductase [Gordonibacter massiliensis (ex Traore et al. 2017)]